MSEQTPEPEQRRYSEQDDDYDANLIADLEAKAARWKGKPWGYLLSEAAARLHTLAQLEPIEYDARGQR